MRGRILYLTVDGLLEGLGFSQVLRVVEALGRRGWPYTIFSLEKPRALESSHHVRAVRSRLQSAGVDWRYVPYASSGSGRDAVANESALVSAGLTAARRGWLGGIHARAYHGAFAALATWFATGTPYLFDARSYWFDERLEDGRWFTSPLRLAVARGVERQLFAQADGVVSLTELQAADVRGGKFGEPRQRTIECITTCADFEDFKRRPVAQCTSVPVSIREKLGGKCVVGIIGSINRSYLVDETLELAANILRREQRAHLLILSAQQEEYARRVSAAGLDVNRVTITSANHAEMPQWLSLLDWGLMLLNPSSPAKRASMPTKLGEFLACGVRPIQFGCNEEVSAWVRRAGSGLVLEDVGGAGLASAAERIVSAPRDEALAQRAREVVAPHFSLASGLDKYERVLRSVFGWP